MASPKSKSGSLQSELANEIKKAHKDAYVKKVDVDNFLDIHIPSVHEKRGSHLFFNTGKNEIKTGFFVKDENFVKKALAKSDNIETYSNGLRPLGNPSFTNVQAAVKAAMDFLAEISGKGGKKAKPEKATKKSTTAKAKPEKASKKNTRRFSSEEGEISKNISNKGINTIFTIDDFDIIHTLTILYCVYASNPHITDSSLDLVIEKIKTWDFKTTEKKKNEEILKSLTWFSKEYSSDLFPKLKEKFSILAKLPKSDRVIIANDLREISLSIFSLTEKKIELYNSIINNIGIINNDYKIKYISEKNINEFNEKIDIDYKSIVLENFVEVGMIVLLSIDINDLLLATKTDDFNVSMLRHIGKVELNNWNSLEKLTTEDEAKTIKKDFKGVKPEFIVLMYCQGKYIHAFASD